MSLSQLEISLPMHDARAAERSLLTRLENAEPKAIGEAYDRYHRAVRAFARRILGDEALAEDLVHDVFVVLPRAVANCRGDSSLKTFLIGIAVNHARHYLRARGRSNNALKRLASEPAAPSATPERDVRRRELALALQRALDRLPIDQRLAFVLCEVEELSSREAAEIVGAPEATVRTRLHHAKKKLRAALLEEGVR